MADYKKVQEEFRQAQRNLWTEHENMTRATENVQEAERKEDAAGQVLEDTKKRLDTWKGIYERGTFDARQREIQGIQDLAPKMEALEGLTMPLPEELEVLNEDQKEILKKLAAQSEKAQKEGISLEAYNQAAADLKEIRNQIPDIDIMENTINSLQKTAKEEIDQGKKTAVIGHLSEKLPYVSERSRLYEKYGAQVEEMVEILNKEIDADPFLKRTVKSVEDVWAEDAFITAVKQEMDNQKNWKTFPKNAEEIIKLGKEDPRRMAVLQEMTQYEEKKQQVESARSELHLAGMDKEKIPETFTEFKKLAGKNPELYQAKEKQLDQMMQSRMTDVQKNNDRLPKNLKEYLEKEQELEAIKADIKWAKKNSKGTVYQNKSKLLEELEPEFTTWKAQIKTWIKEENTKNSAKYKEAYKAKETVLEDAEKELKKAGKNLEEAGKNYDKNPEKILKTTLDHLTQVQKDHEKLLADRVEQWNRNHKAALSDEQEFEKNHQKEREKLLKAVKETLSENMTAQGKIVIEALKMDQKEVERQKQGLEDLLKEENRRILAANEKINEKNRNMLKEMVRQEYEEVKKYWNGQEDQLKSDCRKADFMSSMAGIAANAVGYVTESVRDLMMAVTDAAIKGEVEEEREKAEAIKEKLDEIERRQEERIDHMAQEAGKGEPGKTAVNVDAISQDLNRAEELNQKREELKAQLIAQNQLINSMDAELDEKIRKNHAAIDGAFGIITQYDEKESKEYLSQMEAIYKEAGKNSSLQQKLAEAGTLAEKQNIENMTAENKQMMEELEKSKAFIRAGSDKAASLLKPSSIEKINTFLDISMKVVNFALKKSADANNAAKGVIQPAVPSEIHLSEQLDGLKEKLKNPEASTTPQVFQQLMEIGTNLCGTLKNINQGVQDFRKEAHSTALDKHCEMENMQKLQKGFQTFQEETKDDPEMEKKSYAEQLKMFLKQQSDSARKIVGEQTELLQNAVETAETHVELAQEQTTLKKQDQERQSEQEKEAENLYQQKKKELEEAFLDTVREHGNDPNGHVTISSEALSLAGEDRKERGFSFLSRLTGVAMNENMNLEDAMDAFGKIYISGLNASAYFQMGSRYPEAAKGTEEDKKQFLQELAAHGDDLRSAMEHTMYQEAGKTLSEDAKQLAGQMFAVENANMMLQPVLLEMPASEHGASMSEAAAKKVANYNRYVQMTTDSFNQFRKEAAGMNQQKTASASGMETGRKKVSLEGLEEAEKARKERMTRAVHTSRQEALEKRNREKKLSSSRIPRPGR